MARQPYRVTRMFYVGPELNDPGNGVRTFALESSARAHAAEVSRSGGRATVVHRDPETGAETPVVAYAPYDVEPASWESVVRWPTDELATFLDHKTNDRLRTAARWATRHGVKARGAQARDDGGQNLYPVACVLDAKTRAKGPGWHDSPDRRQRKGLEPA